MGHTNKKKYLKKSLINPALKIGKVIVNGSIDLRFYHKSQSNKREMNEKCFILLQLRDRINFVSDLPMHCRETLLLF